MRSSLVSLCRRAAALFLVLVIGITSFTTPAFASENYDYEKPFSTTLAEDAAKAAVTTSVTFLAPPTICLAADAVATLFFPPAAALAPYCASFAIPAGATGAAISGAAESMKIAQKAMAY